MQLSKQRSIKKKKQKSCISRENYFKQAFYFSGLAKIYQSIKHYKFCLYLQRRIIRSQCLGNKLWSKGWTSNSNWKYLSKAALWRRGWLNLQYNQNTWTLMNLWWQGKEWERECVISLAMTHYLSTAQVFWWRI